jgi:hypothetical protein
MMFAGDLPSVQLPQQFFYFRARQRRHATATWHALKVG